ncbi:MAG: DsbA family protein [Caulobacterales bacterium]
MRRIAVLLLGLMLAGALAACHKTVANAGTGDMTLGSPAAKVTVVEYASVACPICAKWNNEVFPAFKTKYVDSGKVRYVSREMLTHDPAVAAAGFLLARCAGKDKYFQVTDAIYRQQDQMFAPGASPRDTLLAIAQKQAGLSEAQFDACVNDDKAQQALNARVDTYSKIDKINATPTFVIDGKVFDAGFMSLDDMDKAITAAEAGAK